MSATSVEEIPTPIIDLSFTHDNTYPTPAAPMKPKGPSMNVKAIPFTLKEEDSLENALEPETMPENEWKDPNDFLEAVFFNRHKNLIYKIYIDGTWESLRVSPELLM